MERYFFKKHSFFDLKLNKYDVGKPFWFMKSHSDMQFLIKIVELNSSQHPNLYNHHKTYYLNSHLGAQEKVFFKELFDLVNRSNTKELQKDPTKMQPGEKSKWEKRILKYESFLKMMETNDNWGILKPGNESEEINELRKEIEKLKSELSKYRVKPEHKIEIIYDDKETIIELFHQMQKLKHWDPARKDKELLRTHSQNTWAKILANYFTVGDEHIPFNTVKKHFRTGEIGKYSKNSHYEIKIK